MASTISCFLSIFCLTRILFSFCNCDDQLNNLTVEAELVGLTFESEAEKSNQKQYVDLLIAKVLAQGKDAIDNNEISRTGHDSTSFKHVNSNSPEAFLSSYLRQISNSELGVTAMQEIFDSLPFIEVKENSTQLLHEIIQKLHRKFADYLVVLHQNTLFLEKNFGKSGFPFHMKKLPCCHVQAELLRYNEHFGVDIATHRGCDSHLYNNASDEFYAGFLLTSVLKDRLDSLPTLLWQYFISIDGNQFEYPAYSATDSSRDCKLLSDRHREAFQSTIRSAKQVIVVLEQGYALSNAQFETAKGVAKHVLSLLTAYDKVTILGLAADVQYSSGSNCPSQKLVHASPGTKFLLNRFIDSLDRKQNITNHVLGFTKIFELISLYEQGNKTIPGDILIAYISRGLLSSLIDAKQVLEIIADGSRKSRSSVVINTYAIIDDEKPVMLEKPFLKDVAEQNFRNYNIHFRNKQKIKMLAACMQRATFRGIAHIHQRFTLNQFVALSYNFIAFWQFRAIPKDMPHYVPSWQKGQMIPINSTKNLAAKIGNIFGAFPSVLQTNPVFSLPYWDPVSKGMIISITKQVIHSGKLVGIMGIDVSLADVAEDFVTFFNYKRPSYVFLTDTSGIALIHPSLSHPPFANEHQTHTYIWHLEDSPCFKNLSLTILREPNGTQFLPHRMRNASDIGSLIPVEELSIYKWQKIENTPYIVCMVSKGQTKHRKTLRDNTIPDVISFTYHRLDLLPVTSICRHMKQLSSLGVMALFLSSSCFVSPYKYLVEDETRQMVQKYMAYLTDTTKLIANPGLKPGIRSEVLATSWILPTWERASHNDKFSDYIVRRYIATASGVFQVYPATLIDKLYDATRRDWYLRALDHPGRIILTAPYLDIGGAGYVVTLSHTIFEGKPAAMHNSFDNVVAVMGLDFTFGYFYKLLLDKVPICRGEKIICFLLDDRGYLIAHPDLIEPTGRGPVEQQHITHKEPLVANDLLNHKEFVSKKVCNSFSDRTIQRYYQLNTSLQGVLKNHVHGEHCTKYHVMAIPGTNIFLGIVNRTCDGITAFCPCSVTDRLCLNCHRMEPTECECPCECPLALDLCSGKLINESNRYPTCPQFPEEPNLPLVDQVFLEALPPCYEYHCSARTELRDCFGILGCEWCQLEADGTTPLLDKYCTDQRKCFGGILGARTPYADEIIDGIPVEQYLIFKSPVGPVAGGFMVFFLVMALAVYCYRNRVRRGNASQYSISLPDTNLRMTQLNNEPDEPEMFHEAINPVIPACQLIPRADSIVVSPYRVHTNYRRPAGGDSDHGYSTMTPHEDSEHMPYFEPLLIGKDKFFVPASQQSLSSCSRTSSPMSHYPQTLPPVTYIGSPSKTKTDTCVPPWSSKKDAMRSHGSHMVAQVEVHSENVH